MAIEQVQDFFGIKYVIFVDRKTGTPFGVTRVIQGVEFTRTIEQILLQGGDISGSWDSEPGQPENAITTTIREIPDFIFDVMESATLINTAAEALGFVGTITNKSGVSVADATTGIASVVAKAGQEQNIAGIEYVFTARSANTVDIAVLGNVTFENINGTVAAGVVIPDTGGTVDVDELGITITGGSGTIAFVDDETARVETRPIHDGFQEIKVGASGVKPREFVMVCIPPEQTSGTQYWIEVHNVTGQGLPWQLTSREWSEATLTLTPNYDTEKDAIYTVFKRIVTSC